MKKNLRYVLLPLTLLFAILAINVLHAPSNTKQTSAAFPQFQTRDLAGHVVTNEVFAGKFTILVLWVVKDTNSRQLLQELTDWQVHESADIQIIGLIGDVKTTDNDDKIALVQTIAQDIPIPQLLVNDDMESFLHQSRPDNLLCKSLRSAHWSACDRLRNRPDKKRSPPPDGRRLPFRYK